VPSYISTFSSAIVMFRKSRKVSLIIAHV
jgi:hypothetical protein